MKRFFVLVMLAAAPGLATPAMAAPPPALPITDLAQLPVVTMKPYDESADADKAVAAAFARAQKSHKRVLIDLGGNWCPDCIVLANLMRLPAMQTFLDAHYEEVAVDVGRFNKNLQIPARWGITKRLEGVPSVLVVEPDGTTLVNDGHISALSDARHMTPQSLAEYLARWTN